MHSTPWVIALSLVVVATSNLPAQAAPAPQNPALQSELPKSASSGVAHRIPSDLSTKQNPGTQEAIGKEQVGQLSKRDWVVAPFRRDCRPPGRLATPEIHPRSVCLTV